MANTVINTPELLNLDSTTGATILAKGTVSERPAFPTFSVDYLVVAGGGAGGYGYGGGGGAGGLRTSYGSASGGGSSALAPLSLAVATNYGLTVGAGGSYASSDSVNPDTYKGVSSSFSTISTVGGGGGGNQTPYFNGGTGGSGGGGSMPASTSAGGSGTANQGYSGGTGYRYGAGGGGGAQQLGENGGTDGVNYGGNGGSGLAVNILNSTNAGTASVGEISGSDVYYAGGGGGLGWTNTIAATGGIGGGGTGVVIGGAAGSNGGPNTGGGGGGGQYNVLYGGSGGSGVVILRYPSVYSITVGSGITEASGSPFTEGSDKVSVFTAGTGTITFTDSTSTNPDEYPINGTLRFNTETNKTEYFDGTGWYEIVDEYASGFVGPATNYFDTKLYTGNGSTQSIGGYINGSASFNGSSSYINLGTGSSGLSGVLNQKVSQSVSFWMNTAFTGISGNSIIYSVYAGSGISLNVYYFTNGTLYFLTRYSNNSTTFTTTQTFNDSQWHHIAVTIDVPNLERKIYIDNTLTSTQSLSSAAYGGGGTTGVALGTNGNFNTQYYKGDLDQVRVYDTALNSTDITALYGETAATATTAAFPSGQTAIATYTMDTSANGLLNTQDLNTVDYPSGAGCLALYEMNGNSNDTSNTYNGTPTNITYQGGAFGQAAVFNGSSSYIQASNAISNLESNFSISVWVNSDVNHNGGIINLGGKVILRTSNAGLVVWQWNANKLIYDTTAPSANSAYYTYSNINPASTWTHITYVKTGTGNADHKLYKNGVFQTQPSATNIASAGWTNLGTTIGLFGQSGSTKYNYFDGSIDQLRIFNTALTQSQVTTLARGIATSYSGAATNVNFNGHLDFQPDFTWIKIRTLAYNHYLLDSVRGATEVLQSNLTSGESTQSTSLTSFDTNGFTVGSKLNVNANTEDFVSWNWKAGGAAVTNNDGTITSQVSANKDSGFSIVKFSGGNSSGTTVGHGLNTPIELLIVKNLNDSSDNWITWHKNIEQNSTSNNTFTLKGGSIVLLNSASATIPSYSYDGQMGATSGENLIAYCWHSVAGYSKIGSYTGELAPKFVQTDFAPRFVLIKRTDSSVASWGIFDSVRGASKLLYPDLSNAEYDWGASPIIQFNSNGFTLTTNNSYFNGIGGQFIYLAIA